jgi:hypothetical protein
MHFEPRLFTPEAGGSPAGAASDQVPDVTAGLPDELATLAEQLGADAELLAGRYPAGARRGGAWRWQWVAAVAAVSFSAGLAGSALSSREWGQAGRPDEALPLSVDSAAARAAGVAHREPRPAELRLLREEDPALRGQTGGSSPERGLASAGPRGPGETSTVRGLDEAALLRRQVTAFEQVIERLQAELRDRADQQSRTDAVVAELRREIEALRQRLEARPNP